MGKYQIGLRATKARQDDVTEVASLQRVVKRVLRRQAECE